MARALILAAVASSAAAFSPAMPKPIQAARQQVVRNVDLTLSDPVVLGGGAVAALVATHPLWLSALGLKKPESEAEAKGTPAPSPLLECVYVEGPRSNSQNPS